MNAFRILGDLSHALSKCILIFAIHINKSAEGVSLITQAFYTVVFCTRYIDIFWLPPESNTWNFIFKIFYITTSIYILFLMLRVYARTREREAAWKLGAYCLGGSIVIAPILNLIVRRPDEFMPNFRPHGIVQMLVDFSLALESVCVLPQLLLLRQTTVPTVIDSFYLVALGSYRALYCLNWIEREAEAPDDRWKPDAISVTFGIIQTILYLDFAWVYWSRQRVKLRAGGIVDGDDLSRGWLLGKIFGRPSLQHDEDDEEGRPALGPDEDDEDLSGDGVARQQPSRAKSSKWGKRGISVRADDSVLAQERAREDDVLASPVDAPDARMKDPDELARVLDEEDDDDDGVLPSRVDSATKPAGISGGEEWRK